MRFGVTEPALGAFCFSVVVAFAGAQTQPVGSQPQAGPAEQQVCSFATSAVADAQADFEQHVLAFSFLSFFGVSMANELKPTNRKRAANTALMLFFMVIKK